MTVSAGGGMRDMLARAFHEADFCWYDHDCGTGGKDECEAYNYDPVASAAERARHIERVGWDIGDGSHFLQADAFLATPEGKAIADVVKAAAAWHAIYGKRFQPDFDDADLRADADAVLDIMRTVTAYLAKRDV